MVLLENIDNNRAILDNFVPRKDEIGSASMLNIYGARGVGKSALVLDYIAQLPKDKSLYIDFELPVLLFQKINTLDLQIFINDNGVKILVLDHYNEIGSMELPIVEQIIIVSRKVLSDSRFELLNILPLDYEEFLAFEHHISQTNGFTHFLKSGTLPQMAQNQKTHVLTIKQFLSSKFSSNEIKLLSILASHNTEHITINQIYTYAKEHIKISKDWLYKTISDYEKEGILYFIGDSGSKCGSKMVLYDYAFSKYLSYNNSFIVQFDALVALTLITHKANIRTLQKEGYIINNTLIVSAPFGSEDAMWLKSQKKFSMYKKEGIQNVIMVTVSSQYEYSIKDIKFTGLPFYEWSMDED